MNIEKAKILLDYTRSSSHDKVIKGLREIKKRLILSSENFPIFKELGIACTLSKLIHNSNEDILLVTLSILSICLSNDNFRKEFHSSTTLSQILSCLNNDNLEDIQWRSIRVVGIQSLHGPSCVFFHEQQGVSLILEFLKRAKSIDGKQAAIKAIRLLGNSPEHCKQAFKENAVSTICEIGIDEELLDLCRVTLKTLTHFLQLNHASFFEQLLNGTKNFKSLVDVYNLKDGELCINIMNIFISITLFSTQSVGQNENLCIKLVEYLCYEKVLFLMASSLKWLLKVKESHPRLVLAFCGLCEKRSSWKVTLQQVLHEKIWYQLTECDGISLFVGLLAEHKDNIPLLLPVLRGLLGVEIIHSLRVMVLKECLTARLLPLMREIFRNGMEHIIGGAANKNGQACSHLSIESTDKRKGPVYLGQESRPRINDSSENHKMRPDIEASYYSASNSHDSDVCEINPSTFKSSSHSLGSTSSLSSGGMTDFTEDNDNDKISGVLSSQNHKDCSSSVHLTEDLVRKQESASIIDSANSSGTLSNNVESNSGCNSKTVVDKCFVRQDNDTHNDLRYWTTITEYILRLLYQIIIIKGDISLICKEFLPLICKYMTHSKVVHNSAISIMTEIAKKSSCIQPLLDTLIIPSMAVELKGMTSSTECSQCQTINKGIEVFLVELRQFFTHRHQYGRCEISGRLLPSKALDLKHKCLLAVPHIVKCPRLLNSLLQQDKGIEILLKLLEDNIDDPSINLLSIAAFSILISTLKIEYDLKKQNLCMFCASNFDSIYGDSKFTKEEKRQLLILTNSKYTSESDSSLCLLETSKDKNLSLRSGPIVVQANREFLSEKNEVLRAMLSGHFSESSLNEIEIKDIDAQCLEMMVHFLYGCTCQIFQKADLESYLELIFISQMYFMPNLGILAAHHLCSLILAEDIFCVLEKALPILEDEMILQHLICAFMAKGFSPCWVKSPSWFHDILNSPMKGKFLKLFRLGLLRLLNTTSVFCSCDMFFVRQKQLKKVTEASLSYDWAYC